MIKHDLDVLILGVLCRTNFATPLPQVVFSPSHITTSLPVTKSGTGDTSLYRFLTKGQQWLWIKTRGVVKYQEGTKQPTSIICHNIVASYAEVWQYLQNKTRQYGPKERRLMAAPPPDVARTVAASTKTEQTSPGNGECGYVWNTSRFESFDSCHWLYSCWNSK